MPLCAQECEEVRKVAWAEAGKNMESEDGGESERDGAEEMLELVNTFCEFLCVRYSLSEVKFNAYLGCY